MVAGLLGVEPLFDLVEERLGLFLSQSAASHGVKLFGLALDLVELLYPGEHRMAAQGVAAAGVVKVPPRMPSAGNFDGDAAWAHQPRGISLR